MNISSCNRSWKLPVADLREEISSAKTGSAERAKDDMANTYIGNSFAQRLLNWFNIEGFTQ
jgi:hypothetical protein